MGAWIIPFPTEVGPCPVPQCWEQTPSSVLCGVTLSCPMAPCCPTMSDWEGLHPAQGCIWDAETSLRAGSGTLSASTTSSSCSWTQKPVTSSKNCR